MIILNVLLGQKTEVKIVDKYSVIYRFHKKYDGDYNLFYAIETPSSKENKNEI